MERVRVIRGAMALGIMTTLACAVSPGEDPFGSGDGSDGPGTTSSSSASQTAGTSSSDTGGSGSADDDASDDDGGIKLDVAMPDAGGCGGGEPMVEFSYLWVANSAQGSVSKIDTVTAQEVARYRTRADPPADVAYPLRGPSRTSVNPAGDMVVVNRDDAGAVKIAARLSDCIDRNGNGIIDTSSGSADLLDWSTGQDPQDECIVWHTPLPMGSRPAAWTAGTEVAGDCGSAWVDMQVWAAAPDPGVAGGAIVYLLDGDDGSIADSIAIPPVDCECGVYGPYGGAVDGNDDLWTFGQDGSGGLGGGTWGYGPLIHVQRGDDGAIVDYQSYPFPEGQRAGYGIMVDRDGYPWLAGFESSLLRFDPAAETFDVIDTSSLPDPHGAATTLRGIQQGLDGDIFVAVAYGYPTMFGGNAYHGLLRVDATALSVIELVGQDQLPGLLLPAGVSVDYEGYVWMVDTLSNSALKIDPDDYSYETVTGLATPYTYSDMTGVGLLNAGVPAG